MTQLEPIEKPEIKTIVDYIKLDSIIESAERTLGERGRQFLTSILSFANSNPAIMECEPRSVYTACLTAATLDLPINQNLGFAYIVPYKNKGKAQAQFQMGYKGFIQLAIRTGKYSRLGANKVYEGQLVGLDDFSGEPIFNFNAEHNETVVGYMAYFELTNGFRKASFMSLEQVEKHGKKYSQSYKKGFGVWKDDFEGMAKKTVLKLLLSKFAPLSTQLEEAIVYDQKAADEYVDNKITFEVEGATVGDEPIEAEAIEAQAEENYLDEPKEFTVEESVVEGEPPKVKEALITQAQMRKAFAILNKLPEQTKAGAEAGRKTLFGENKSRRDYTQTEANKWIEYLESLKEEPDNE
jgi:recombination protein RecT